MNQIKSYVHVSDKYELFSMWTILETLFLQMCQYIKTFGIIVKFVYLFLLMTTFAQLSYMIQHIQIHTD